MDFDVANVFFIRRKKPEPARKEKLNALPTE
jgi:hypothetical protein